MQNGFRSRRAYLATLNGEIVATQHQEPLLRKGKDIGCAAEVQKVGSRGVGGVDRQRIGRKAASHRQIRRARRRGACRVAGEIRAGSVAGGGERRECCLPLQGRTGGFGKAGAGGVRHRGVSQRARRDVGGQSAARGEVHIESTARVPGDAGEGQSRATAPIWVEHNAAASIGRERQVAEGLRSGSRRFAQNAQAAAAKNQAGGVAEQIGGRCKVCKIQLQRAAIDDGGAVVGVDGRAVESQRAQAHLDQRSSAGVRWRTSGGDETREGDILSVGVNDRARNRAGNDHVARAGEVHAGSLQRDSPSVTR